MIRFIKFFDGKLMKKILILLLCFMYIGSAMAADESLVVSLFEGEDIADIDAKAEKDDDEGGIFSFLNFKKDKNKSSNLNVADKKRLSVEGQTIKLAEAGDVEAQLLLGYSYLYGENNFPVNYEKSFEYYAKASLQGNPIALNNLGSLYYSGVGVDRNSAKAAVLFEKSANLGNTEAAVNLGFILISGNGQERNPQLAMQYFEKASKVGNAIADFMVGYAHYKGVYRDKDFAKAAQLIKKSAIAGFDEAQYVLAQMYINGHGVPQNYGNAVKNLKAAVTQGSVEAMVDLGYILAQGEKYAKDLYAAHIMYNIAAVYGAYGAAELRDEIGSKLKIDTLLQAQAEAERYSAKPTELSKYIRQTFGANVRQYFDF